MSIIDGFLKSHGNSRGYRNVKQQLVESGVHNVSLTMAISCD